MTARKTPLIEAYEFGPFRADVQRRQLTRDGVDLPIKSRNFSLLQFLLENRGRTLPKEEIIDHIWTETSVGESNLIVNISAIRRLLGEHPRDHRYILTHNGVGYEFVAPVREIRARPRIPHSPARDSRVSPFGDPVHLAILPFRAVGDLEEHAYLLLGLTDTLITEFSRNKRLAVRSTGTVRRYIDTEATVEDIAQALRVEAIVDGTIHREDRRLKIQVQLISAHQGMVRWAGTYSHSPENLFEIQGRILADLCRELGLSEGCAGTSQRAHHGTTDTLAHQHYLRGRYHLSRFAPSGFFEAVDCFRAALDIDPGFVNALSGLSQAQHAINWFGYLPAREIVPEAEANARRALEIDPELPEARVALASVLMTYHRDWEGAERNFLRALATAPNLSSARFHYAFLLTRDPARLEEAERQARWALALEPSSLMMNTAVGTTFHYQRQFARARAQVELTLQMDPRDVWARFFAGWTSLPMGDYETAQRHYRELEAMLGQNPWTDSLLGMVSGFLGDREEADRRLEAMERAAQGQYVPELYRAMVHFGCGRKDETITALEKCNEEREAYMCWMEADPVWDDLRSNPRFLELAEKVRAAS